ncbi:MAG: PTS fructose transporter subunit EIIBC, partial [Haemophilus parainfluenzae]|nr:PTS fructose transporter subunit EIIBC [Haemophilus parainfluenzae]
MNLFLTQSPQIGAAKSYLLRQALSEVAKKANHTLVEQAKEADLVIVFGSSLPNSADLVGKKVFLANEDAVIASPEVTLTNALNQAVDYVQPTQSAVGFGGVSGVKNIVAVTACPTGVAHTF